MLYELSETHEKALRAIRLKDDFIARISHEVRNFIQGILGMATLLKSSGVSTDQSMYIDNILFAADMINRIFGNKLDYARLESGELSAAIETVDLLELLRAITHLHTEAAAAKGLVLKTHLPPTIPVTVQTDPVRLSQILGNILSNAIKFTDKGGISLTLSVQNNSYTIRIKDTGRGMSNDELSRIFEAYYRTESAQKTPGAGLGLSISAKLAALLGGELKVHSELGVGTEFSLNLPFVP
jgi:signal transduction histidine kinase